MHLTREETQMPKRASLFWPKLYMYLQQKEKTHCDTVHAWAEHWTERPGALTTALRQRKKSHTKAQ